jgi:hypothetical protein
MVEVANKHILLEVADEVEQDVNYSGDQYWFRDRDCGCAMMRIIGRAGEYDKEAYIEGTHKNNMPFRIEGYPNEDTSLRYSLNVEGGVAHITGLDSKVWFKFLSFSLEADRFWTAKALREIAEVGTFEETRRTYIEECGRTGKQTRLRF